MGIALGVDPDSCATGWAVASENTILAVGVIRGPGDIFSMWKHSGLLLESVIRKHSPAIAVIEGQHHHGAVPDADITKLSHIAGGIGGQLALLFSSLKLVLPEPGKWKGQTPKVVNQARTMTHYGVLFERLTNYCVPTGCATISRVEGALSLNRGDWKHVGDAIGLARYGSKLV